MFIKDRLQSLYVGIVNGNDNGNGNLKKLQGIGSDRRTLCSRFNNGFGNKDVMQFCPNTKRTLSDNGTKQRYIGYYPCPFHLCQ